MKKLFTLAFVLVFAVSAFAGWNNPFGGPSGGGGSGTSIPGQSSDGTNGVIQTGNGQFGSLSVGATTQFQQREVAGVPQYSLDGGVTWLVPEPNPQAYSSAGTADQGTKNINIDGFSYSDYTYSPNTGTAATYTPVITSPPTTGMRPVLLTVGGGTNGATITWTNVDPLGAAMATSVASGKFNHYALKVWPTGHAQCAIIGEGSSY